MPASNIYIDFRASNTSTSTTDVTSELSLATADNIGATNIPTVLFFSPTSSGFTDTSVTYTTSATISGAENILQDYYSAVTVTSGSIDKEMSYSIGDALLETGRNVVGDYFTPDVLGSGYQDIRSDYIIGLRYASTDDILQQFWVPLVYSGTLNYEVDFVGGFGIPYYKNALTTFIIGTSTSGFDDANVDLTFAGYVFNDIPADVFACVPTASGMPTEATVISGSTLSIGTEIISCLTDLASFSTNAFCSVLGNSDVLMEATTISGGLGFIYQDVVSSAIGSKAMTCDIDLLSLKISNFSLDVGQWEDADGQISVDITDDTYPVTVSGCYFKVDGQQVSVTTSGITDGVRMFYDPINDFEGLEGPSVLTARAENNNGDVLEQDFNLTFGYIVEYTNFERFGWNYGQGEKVVVRMSAENMANCPESSADAYWFETREIDRRELTANITGHYSWDDSEDLSASIYPQSTAYFYGKVFRVKLTAKDLAGNEMEPLEFEYKIEDKPEE